MQLGPGLSALTEDQGLHETTVFHIPFRDAGLEIKPGNIYKPGSFAPSPWECDYNLGRRTEGCLKASAGDDRVIKTCSPESMSLSASHSFLV